MRLDIVTPERTVYSKQVKMVKTRAANGDIGILPKHAPLISPLEPTVVEVTLTDDTKENIAVSGGFLDVHPERVTILAEAAELPNEIDLERAQAAKQRAEQRLAQKNEVDVLRAQLALKRAMNRIKVYQKA